MTAFDTHDTASDPRFAAARADAVEMTRLAISDAAARYDAPGILLTIHTAEKLVLGLATLEPAATMDLLDAWKNWLVLRHGDSAAIDRLDEMARTLKAHIRAINAIAQACAAEERAR